jgi:hypothetical protein
VNGRVVCAACREAVAREQAKTAGAIGVIRAIGAGLGAGLLGAIVYYAVLALTGYELALISIAVGYGVGRVVRWASEGRGGRIYQVIAVVITYVAIVGSYAPIVLGQVRKDVEAKRTSVAMEGQTSPRPPSQPQPQLQPQPTGPAQTPAPLEVRSNRGFSLVGFAVGWIILIILLLPLPLMAGFQNIIGLIIIGLALWEAWKTTRRATVTIAGPFTLTASAP